MVTETRAARKYHELNVTMKQVAVTVAQRVDATLMRPQSVCQRAVRGRGQTSPNARAPPPLSHIFLPVWIQMC